MLTCNAHCAFKPFSALFALTKYNFILLTDGQSNRERYPLTSDLIYFMSCNKVQRLKYARRSIIQGACAVRFLKNSKFPKVSQFARLISNGLTVRYALCAVRYFMST